MSNDAVAANILEEVDDPFKPRAALTHSPKSSQKEYREAANTRSAVSVKCESLRGTSGGLRESTPQPYGDDVEEDDDLGPVINAEEDGDLVARVQARRGSGSGSGSGSGVGRSRQQHPAARALAQQAMGGRQNSGSHFPGSEEDESAAGEADARPAVADLSPEWPPHGRAMHSFLDLEEPEAGDPEELPATPPDEPGGPNERGSQTAVFGSAGDVRRESSYRKDMMKYSDSDIVKIKQQLQTEHQASLATRERQWEEKLRKVESDNATLREEKDRMLLNLDEMKNCVLEYERTLKQVLEDRSKGANAANMDTAAPAAGNETGGSQAVAEIVAERDQALEDLATVEKAFGDLHRRFEKSKQVIEAVKKNEETLKKCLQETMAKLKRHEQKYQTLKQHAEEKLDQANNEIERIRRQSEAELTRLQAGAKKAELQVQGLDSQLEQKKRENAELAQICDELISKCGGNA